MMDENMIVQSSVFTNYETSLVKNTSIADIDSDTLKRYLYNRFYSLYANHDITEMSLLKYTVNDLVRLLSPTLTTSLLLKHLGLIGIQEELPVFTLLLLGKYPQEYLSYSQFVCKSFAQCAGQSSMYVVDQLRPFEMGGNLFRQFDILQYFVRRNVRNEVAEFEDCGSRPVARISDALLINALLHRDYSLSEFSELNIQDGRLEVKSPGALPQGVTIQAIGEGLSLPTNPLLFQHAQYLLPSHASLKQLRDEQVQVDYRMGVDGESFIALYNYQINNHFTMVSNSKELEKQSSERTTNYESNSELLCHSATNHQKKDENLMDRAEANEESVALSTNYQLFDDEDLTTQPDIVTNHQNHPCSQTQEEILSYCQAPRTAREILEHIGVTNQTFNRRRYILPLVENGRLRLTIPSNPKDKNQRYVTIIESAK